ncbi:MAG: hypothetical protein Q8O46_00775 [bacterium]|nr:hypothetical protein [bacterium]
MEILGKILGNPARVKTMRVFLLNPKTGFNNQDIGKRCRVGYDVARKEIRLLASVNFIKKNTKGGWVFNPLFKYASPLEVLLVNSDTIEKEQIANVFKKTGRVKLLIVSGIFIKNKDTRVDLLIVGDRMRKGKVQEEVRKLEAEIGTELSYAIFETQEFIYRLNMYDKLIRDILDFPHEVVLESKELSTQVLKKT